MKLESLMGRYFRLEQELSIAYRAFPWQARLIDRLAGDLAATEREIGAMQSVHRPSNDSLADRVQHGRL